VLWASRITIAAMASYVVATRLFPGTEPLLAPLTALLVVQVTPVSLLASGLDRVVSVVAGVAVAVGFAAVVPLEWWSLGLLILVSLLIGQALRLRSNLMEVAISGMLVLGVGSLGAESAAWQRITETLVGAAVGILTNLLFPPKVAAVDAGVAIDGLADSVSGLLSHAADELPRTVEEERDLGAAARDWLGDARRINHDIPRVGAALLRAEESRRLNVRALATPNVGPGLRQGLEALEHSTVAIRGMFRALVDATNDPTGAASARSPDEVARLVETFRAMAAGIDAFGQLVRDDAEPSRPMSSTDVEAVRDGLSGLHDAAARLQEAVLTGAPPGLVDLHASLLLTVKRLLGELDLDERIRRQVRQPQSTRPRLPHPGSPLRRTRPTGATGATEVAPELAPELATEFPPEAETEVLPRIPSDDDGDPHP
jgi:hypothetical protein